MPLKCLLLRLNRFHALINMNKSDVQYNNHWADLSFDLLDEIAKHVNYGDYIRLRAVCKNWSLELPKIPEHAKNPWLVLPFDDENEIAPFFNLGENKYYNLELPEIQETVLRGSCYGWLITIAVDGALQILNPFTRAQIDLPPLATFPDVKGYIPNLLGAEYILVNGNIFGTESTLVDKKRLQIFHIRKIIISAHPNQDHQDIVAIAIYSNYKRLAWCRIGDSWWTDVPSAKLCCHYEDAIFHEGKIYAVDCTAMLYEFDMKTGLGGITVSTPPYVVHPGNIMNKRKYLVETSDGLMMVIRCLKGHPKHNLCYQTYGFEIYNLNKGEWSKVNSLGNHVILLGQNSSLCTTPDKFSRQ